MSDDYPEPDCAFGTAMHQRMNSFEKSQDEIKEILAKIRKEVHYNGIAEQVRNNSKEIQEMKEEEEEEEKQKRISKRMWIKIVASEILAGTFGAGVAIWLA